MSKKNKAVKKSLSRTTASELPHRAALFLKGVSEIPEVNQALAACGYGVADQEEGWALVHKVAATPVPPPVVSVPSAAKQAVGELSAWCVPGFARVQAALRRKHAEQYEFMFFELSAARGIDAVIAIAVFLERCETLEKSASVEDHAALATLELRGITSAERKRLADLVVQAEQKTDVAPVLPKVEEGDVRDEAMLALHAWVQDWTETARAVIPRRDLLLRIGIGKRKPNAAGSDAPPALAEEEDAAQ